MTHRLYCSYLSRTTQILDLKRATLGRLAELLRSRSLPSESVVKLSIIAIGCHWHARYRASVFTAESDAKRIKRRHDAEGLSLGFVLAFFGIFILTALAELENIPSETAELHQHISAVVRRLLPALRIMSKWIKLHSDYISRFSSSAEPSLISEIQSFWAHYKRLTAALARLFPIAQLPTLTDPLEEDEDMRGFVALSRGMAVRGTHDVANGHMETSHPNEEQLMRIADLQVDAKLLTHPEVGFCMRRVRRA